MVNEFKPYVWFKGKVFKAAEPYVLVPSLSPRNYVGTYGLKSEKDFMRDLNYKFNIIFPTKRIVLNNLAPYMRAYFDKYNRNNVKIKIDYDKFIKAFDIKETYDDPGQDTMRSWTQVKKISQTIASNNFLSNTYLEDEVNSNFLVNCERQGNTPNHHNPMPRVTPPTGPTEDTTHKTDLYSFNYNITSSTLPVATKQFVMTPSEVDWMVRANKVWLEQSKGLGINRKENQKSYMTNVVGGPKLKTLFGSELLGYFTFTPPKIDITLPSRRIVNKSWTFIDNQFTEMLVHEYTHFLQQIYVKSLGDYDSSFWNLPKFSNVKKYYKSMWERDAYSMQYLWLFLMSKGLQLQTLADPKVLKLNFTEESFKAFLLKNDSFKWHLRRMPEDMNDIFIRGVIYGAKKFINAQQTFAPQNEEQDEVLEFKPQYRADVTSSNKENNLLIYNEKDDINNCMKSNNIKIIDYPVMFKPKEIKDELNRQNLTTSSFKAVCYAANVNGIVYRNSLSDAVRCANYYTK
jgi:hypothetical protein